MGRGIVGGPLMQTQALGQQAAEVGLRILKGEKPGGINSPYVLFGHADDDSREFSDGTSTNPECRPAASCNFASPIAWEQYRWQIIAITAVLLAQAAVIIWLFCRASPASSCRGGTASASIGSHSFEPHGCRGRIVSLRRS